MSMITKDEIDQKAMEFGINPANVEKDYVYSWVLDSICDSPLLGKLLVLKGGNCLRKCFLPNTRFSKDLDFSVESSINPIEFEHELDLLCSRVTDKSGVVFDTDRTLLRSKNVSIPNTDILEARLYFKGFYGDENISLRTQLDITQFDKIYLPKQNKKIFHPYSDASHLSGIVLCQKSEEVLASKLNSLLHRKKVSDLFDLLYSIVFTKDYQVNKLEVITTFLKKSIYDPTPELAKQQLIAVELESFRTYWQTLIAPSVSLLSFDSVVEKFAYMINDLFALLSTRPPAPSFAYAQNNHPGYPTSRYGARSITPSYFSSNVRNTIIQAGQSESMIEMSYDGYTRLVEPYKMEYYVRKDGIGSEYFWGYDTTGGKSGKQSIKMFFCDKIENAHNTDEHFSPRYNVEF